MAYSESKILTLYMAAAYNIDCAYFIRDMQYMHPLPCKVYKKLNTCINSETQSTKGCFVLMSKEF